VGAVAISCKTEVSAIYYALLQLGYEFYALDKAPDLALVLAGFRREEIGFDPSFFSAVKQASCAVYPYWPRAFALEVAAFHVCPKSQVFLDFPAYKQYIMDAPNIADRERDEGFWSWVERFPQALRSVMEDGGFREYLAWERSWMIQQRELWSRQIQSIGEITDVCEGLYHAPAVEVSTILTPIKCSYSADYFKQGNRLNVVLGSFRMDAIIHEYLHPVLRSVIQKHAQTVLACNPACSGIDSSYFAGGGAQGILSAFEEYMVRQLTDDLLESRFPESLDEYILRILRDGA